MRLRDHMTYANVMATIAVFGVVGGGGAYAASKIHTRDIANEAVTAKKLDRHAVRKSKLGPRAVTSGKLANGAVKTRNLSREATLAMAGVYVYNDEIFGWFNRFNDEMPTLEHTQPGIYHLRIPGLSDSGLAFTNFVSSVNLMSNSVPWPGEISADWAQTRDGNDLHPIIYTFDSSGSPADRSFSYIVYRADHSEL